jgi:hypothetical protein
MKTQYEPATFSDLNEPGDKLLVYCLNCRYNALLDPETLKIPGERPIPSLTGIFKCSQCDSKNTAAEPRYAVQFVNAARPAGVGWMMPPE